MARLRGVVIAPHAALMAHWRSFLAHRPVAQLTQLERIMNYIGLIGRRRNLQAYVMNDDEMVQMNIGLPSAQRGTNVFLDGIGPLRKSSSIVDAVFAPSLICPALVLADSLPLACSSMLSCASWLPLVCSISLDPPIAYRYTQESRTPSSVMQMERMEKQRELIRKLYKTRLSCGKSLLELTTYNNTAMWWMVHPMFVDVMCTKGYFPARRMRFLTILYKTAGPVLQITLDISLMILLRLILAARMREGHNKRAGKEIAFLTQNTEWGNIKDVETGTNRRGDRFFDPLITVLRNQGYRILSFYPVAVHPVRGVEVLIEKMEDWDVAHVPLEMYGGIDVCKEYLSACKNFRRMWKTLRNDATFKRIGIFDRRDGHNKMMEHLEFYFVFLFPFLVRESRLCRCMLKREKPSAMVVTNEYGWIERSYLVSAKAESVPVIAIQHGAIHAEHKGYIYDKDDIQCGHTNHPCCPIPDKTAVSGTCYFDLLTQASAYPEDSVVITGQPRYDILYYAPKVYSRERFLERNSINPNHRIILWTTQSHGFSDQEDQKTYECVFKTMQEIDNATLIVKQHPGEPKRYTKRIMSNVRQFGNKNVVLMPKDSDIHELVFVCDLLITKNSTTAIEAAALDKPVIVLNLSEDEELADYVEEGIAAGVRKSDDLRTVIQRLLDDDSVLAVHRERYVADHLLRIDGESSKRVADLVVKMIL